MEDFRKYAEEVIAARMGAIDGRPEAVKGALRDSRAELKSLINSKQRARAERDMMIMDVHIAIANAEYKLAMDARE
jgi:hypothetical protein